VTTAATAAGIENVVHLSLQSVAAATEQYILAWVAIPERHVPSIMGVGGRQWDCPPAIVCRICKHL